MTRCARLIVTWIILLWVSGGDASCDPIVHNDLKPETNFSCSNGNEANSQCTFFCPEGFRLSNGISTISCQIINGSSTAIWSDDIPDCVYIDCNFNGNTLHSAISYHCTESNLLNSVCEFKCPSTMAISTNYNQTVCQDVDGDGFANWSLPMPSCQDIHCGLMPSRSQLNTRCTNGDFGGSECIFWCATGYKLDRNIASIVCEDSDSDGMGEWSSTPPRCYESWCKEINQRITPETVVTCSNWRWNDSVCTFSCPLHMRLDAEVTSIKCVDDKIGRTMGNWDNTIPYCMHMCAPPLVAPHHGRVECSNLNREGSECMFECDRGFVLSHVNLVICGLNAAGNEGEWKGVEPICEPFEFYCPPLSYYNLSPETTALCTNLNNRDSKCTFKCARDTKLTTGISTIQCVDRDKNGIGEWSNKPPQCRKTSCSLDNTEIEHGTASCTSLNMIDSVCSYHCNAGFHISSPYATVCKENGFWNSSIPKCDPDKCYPDLDDVFTHDAECLGGNNPGAECDVKCSHKSPKYGDKVRYVCGSMKFHKGAGFWNADLVSCAGCGSGILDLMFLLDGSVNLPLWEFLDMRDWIPDLLYKIRKVVNYGATFVSVAVAGSRDKKCNPRYTTPIFKLELKLNFRLFENIKREVHAINQLGGCLHLGHGIHEALKYLNGVRRPSVTTIMVLLMGGGSHDGIADVISKAKSANIAVFSVSKGGKAMSLLRDKWIRSYDVKETEDVVRITQLVLQELVKYDCKDYSMCSGPMANGSVICSVDKYDETRERCRIYCDENYQLVGPDSALCGDLNGDGKMEWLSPHGTCSVVTCPAIKATNNMVMECSKEYFFSSVCKFTCKEGLSMIGQSELVCGDPEGIGRGEWHAEIPLCTSGLYCIPRLSAPYNGTMNCTNHNFFGSQCTFQCEPGHTLQGSGDIACQDAQIAGQAEWSDAPPMCSGCSEGEHCARDVIFALDGSDSISLDDFEQAKHIILSVFGAMRGEIDSGATRVGIIQYSGGSSFLCSSGILTPKYTIELELGQYLFRQVEDSISVMIRIKGCAATGHAISLSTKHFLALGREFTDRVLIILTDQRPDDDVTEPARMAKKAGVEIIVIKVGTFNSDPLLAISGRTIAAESYNEVANLLGKIQKYFVSNLISHRHGGSSPGMKTSCFTICTLLITFCVLVTNMT